MFCKRIEDDSEESYASCIKKLEVVLNCSLRNLLVTLLAVF